MAEREQSEVWSGVVGDAWVRHGERYDATLEPFGRAVFDALDLQPGERVLDLGCGTGTTTLEAARRVAPGAVVGVDVSPPMLAEARRRAAGAGLDQVTFVEADLQTAELPAADVACSRFGVMFFEDPAAAFANVCRALTPGGRLGFVCFQSPAANPFIVVPVFAAAGLLGMAPPDPSQPSPFSLADPDATADLLRTAGFADVTIAPGPDEAVLPGADDLPALAERLLEQNPASAERLAAAAPEVRRAAIEATAAALAPHRTGDEVRLGAGTWVVLARAPDDQLASAP